MAFEPKYTITDKILNNLTGISAAREVVERSRLIPKWEAKLRRMALLHNTHSSTAIEGNKLTLEQVESLSEGKEVIATNKDKKEVLNYLGALKKIPNFTSRGNITGEDLLEMQKLVTQETLENESDCGVFRNRQVFVGKRVFEGTGYRDEVEYMPPETKEVPSLVEDMIDWLNEGKTWNINPVLLAGIVHYEIARIHPFIDGNGRTARLFATLVLYLSGFDHRRFFALDDFYDRDRKAYYAALKTAQESGNDLTKWLEYFTTGVAVSVKEVKEQVIKLGGKKKKTVPQIELTPKQMEIVEIINEKGRITNKDMQAVFMISAQAVHKELTKLVKMKVIKPSGRGRTLHYVLV